MGDQDRRQTVLRKIGEEAAQRLEVRPALGRPAKE
jgi:hypothetical protein